MARYKSIVEYDGTEYHGFQIQPASQGSTIQAEIECAIERIIGKHIRVFGAGRTDAGVHATGQVIHFSDSERYRVESLQKSINAVLPKSIVLRGLSLVPDEFHARYDALSRSYVYTIWNHSVRSPLYERYSFHYSEGLDTNIMQTVCDSLVGRHDFAAFGHSPVKDPSTVHTTVRTIFQATCSSDQSCIRFLFTGNAFLTGMIRKMVGTILLVGRKHLTIQEFLRILQSADYTRSGPLVPARGLCLIRVTYPDIIDFNIPIE